MVTGADEDQADDGQADRSLWAVGDAAVVDGTGDAVLRPESGLSVLQAGLRRHDGPLDEVSLRLSPILDDAERLVGASAVAPDLPAAANPSVAPVPPPDEPWYVHRDQNPLPHAVVSLDGRLTSVNDAFCRLFDRPRTELVGVDALRHPSNDMEDPLRAVLDGRREAQSWERILLRRDGAPIPALVHASLLRRADGTPDAATIFVLDTTRQQWAEGRLRRQEALFDALARRASDRAFVLDVAGLVRYVSPTLISPCGYPPGEMVGRIGWESAHPDDVAAVRRVFQKVIRTGCTEVVTFRVADGAGQWCWVEAVFTNHLNDPQIAGVVCNRRDVTARMNAERALRDAEARYRIIAETAQEGVWTVDTNGRTRFANGKLADILGVSSDTVYAGSASEILSPHDPTFVEQRLSYQQERGIEQYELTYPHPDGQPRILRLSVNPLHGEAGQTGLLMMITDVTAARRAEAELRRRVLFDELTGLANRDLLLDRLEYTLARTGRRPATIAVLFADLDQFKLVNDSWGHGTGDRLLIQVARRLADAVRSSDTVGRFGGDEFVVICEDITEERAREVAGRLLDALAEPFEVDGQRVYVRASIGIALSPPGNAPELLRFAEAAMYEAKVRGRSRVQVFDVGLAERASERLELSNDLRDALARDELHLLYQPVVDLTTGRLLGVEALARWNHPRRGPVSPATFVDVAETTGLSTMLDRWVLRRVGRDALRLAPAMPSGMRIAVNISARHLADDDLEEAVLTTARSGPLVGGRLVLEITESAVMDSPERARLMLERLRDRNVETAIDDFGTGYSSLGYLRRLPVSILKIDRCFVQNIADDPDALAIAASIVEMARAVRLTTIAEGVETSEQLIVLRRLGCAAGQGFLWSPAVSPEALVQLMGRLPDGRFAVATEQPVPGELGRRR
ncbi:MAG TPA: EAL domain-containing protein [Actinoplanes sp.]|jgi:diguanylate cyclase (GGDEF)-like protein/PAS domain S-box-containing protein